MAKNRKLMHICVSHSKGIRNTSMKSDIYRNSTCEFFKKIYTNYLDLLTHDYFANREDQDEIPHIAIRAKSSLVANTI